MKRAQHARSHVQIEVFPLGLINKHDNIECARVYPINYYRSPSRKYRFEGLRADFHNQDCNIDTIFPMDLDNRGYAVFDDRQSRICSVC